MVHHSERHDGARTDNGLNVRLILPHVVYLNQKKALKKQDVVIRALEFSPAHQKSQSPTGKPGANLGRVLQVAISDGHATGQPSGGFPLFPHSRRWTEVKWDADTTPDRLTLRFARFTIDTVLSATSAALAADTSASAPRP